MVGEIIKKIEDCVNEIFVEMQDDYDITNGDCSPWDEFELDKATERLAVVMVGILLRQMGGEE